MFHYFFLLFVRPSFTVCAELGGIFLGKVKKIETILVEALGLLTSYLLARLPWFAPFVVLDRYSLRATRRRFTRFTWFISHDYSLISQQVEPASLRVPMTFAFYQRFFGIRKTYKELPSASINMISAEL